MKLMIKPYYESSLGRLYYGDCLDIMPELEQVDLVLTSPQYNLGNAHHTGNKRHHPYIDNMPEKIYQESQIKTISKIYTILKHEGSFLYNHKNRIKNGVQITPYEWLLKTNFIIKQEIVWITRSQNFDKIRFYPWTERVYWLAKSPKTKLFNNLNKYDVFDYTEWKPVGTKGTHTRAFPLKMAEDLIGVFPNTNIILDPFLGSGTTAVACERLGRRWIGIEISEEYCEIAAKRIETEASQLKLWR